MGVMGRMGMMVRGVGRLGRVRQNVGAGFCAGWTERAAPEINQRAFFFVPVFEHKIRLQFLVENGGAKVNDDFFGREVRQNEKPFYLAVSNVETFPLFCV